MESFTKLRPLYFHKTFISLVLPNVSRIMPTNIDSKWLGSQVKDQSLNIKTYPISCGTHFGWIIISCWLYIYLQGDQEVTRLRFYVFHIAMLQTLVIKYNKLIVFLLTDSGWKVSSPTSVLGKGVLPASCLLAATCRVTLSGHERGI